LENDLKDPEREREREREKVADGQVFVVNRAGKKAF
jgi:hypothetical protein